jgi:4'-phosphopantetheinyl transferase
MKVLLSPDEIERAGRFHFERDRNRFIAARGFLRIILSLYLNCKPGMLQFNYSEHGKPSVKTHDHDAAINFNLAHSGTLAIYGITLRRALGLDLEQIRHGFAVEDLARSFFSAAEATRLLKVPPADRREAFFHGWTRKEAFLKAKGQGLSLPLEQFDVTLSPRENPVLLRTQWDPSEASRWSLRTIDVAPGYAASIAVEGHDWRLKCWQASTGIVPGW